MRRPSRSIPFLAITSLVIGCGGEFGPSFTVPRELSVAEADLVDADNRFAFKLLREINRQEGDTNIFISPLSVAMALGMTLNGADGTTEQAMLETLELQGLPRDAVNGAYRTLIDLLRDLDPNVEFLLANSIWYRLGVTPTQEFLDINQQFFDAEISGLNFDNPSAVETINGWVNTNTNGKIEKVLDEIPRDIVMYLINAIYFKGSWTYQFDPNNTQEAQFQLADGSFTTVDMMSQEESIKLMASWDEGVWALELPYGGDAFRMTILLPWNAESIDSLAENLTSDRWNALVGGLDSAKTIVSLPRFRLEYELTLNDVLTALGMGVAFDAGLADFSRMYPGGGVWIDEVLHKTFVEVNEEGTEAAAATVVSMARSGPGEFTVDRPFLFMIRERYSGTILFMGKVMDPNAG